MSGKPERGQLFGIPYNFERPSVKRLFGSYWQPGKGMIVEKPFGIGYTLNLANWRSWVVLGVAAVMVMLDRRSGGDAETGEEDTPIDIIVDEDED